MQASIFKSTALALSLTLAGVFPLAAQQLAANTAAQAECDKIKDPAQSGACHARVHQQFYKDGVRKSEANLAQARVESAEARAGVNEAAALLRCAEFLKSQKAAGVVLDPTRVNREKGCAYAAELGLK